MDTAGKDLCETHLSITFDTAREDRPALDLAVHTVALDTAGEDLCKTHLSIALYQR